VVCGCVSGEGKDGLCARFIVRCVFVFECVCVAALNSDGFWLKCDFCDF
jgi:hypothetical protein